MTHPIHDLDDLVHQRSRLGILVILSEGGRTQFSFLQDTLGLSEGNLSRHLTTLEAAGYVVIEKGYEGRRPRTWTWLTSSGRPALNQELAALKAIVAEADAPVKQSGDHAGVGARVGAATRQQRSFRASQS